MTSVGGGRALAAFLEFVAWVDAGCTCTIPSPRPPLEVLTEKDRCPALQPEFPRHPVLFQSGAGEMAAGVGTHTTRGEATLSLPGANAR